MLEITALLCRGGISEEKAAERARSVLAAVDPARTNRLRKKLCKEGERLVVRTA
jgi:hypothetical protein